MKIKYKTAIALLFCFGLSTGYAQLQLKSGNSLSSSIETTAIFEVQSSSKGILPPRMGTNQRDAIANPVAGLSIYNIDTGCLEFWDSSNWLTVCNDSSVLRRLIGGNAICDGSSPTTVVGITGAAGRTWMDRNLGASRAAIAFNDYEAYGGLYQWGRGNDGHASITWTSSTKGTFVNGSTTTKSATDTPRNNLFIKGSIDWRSPMNDALWQGVTGVNNPCPSGYRIPTIAELYAEFTASNITNPSSAYSSALKMVVAGNRSYINAEFGNLPGNYGSLWSSTVNGAGAMNHNFLSNSSYRSNDHRAYSLSVRCLKD